MSIISQEKFLGHPNFNGHTLSMKVVQDQQQALWANVFASAVRSGKDGYSSTTLADTAVAAFNNRFVPEPSPEPVDTRDVSYSR